MIIYPSAMKGMKPIPVSAIVTRCREAAAVMSKQNSHRNLFLNCALAMEQMVDKLGRAEDLLEKAGLITKEDRST